MSSFANASLRQPRSGAMLGVFILAICTGSSLCAAAPVTAIFNVPDMDRWNYAFNATPGVRASASTFNSLDDATAIFDDRMAQFLIGFDTLSQILPGRGAANYIISSATVTVTIITGGIFEYDPTTDPFQTYLPAIDPEFIPDVDAGRPLEMFGVGYRNGFSAQTFLEDTPYQTTPPGNWQATRSAYPTDFMNGQPLDVSNNVDQRFEVAPFAVGTSNAVTPGALFPSDTDMVFDVDLANPDVVAYLQQSLNSGRLRLMVSSLHFASQVGAQTFPDYYTRENKFAIPFGFAATLSMTVEIVNPADLNGDGFVNAADLATLLTQWGTAGGADFDTNGVVDASDLAFLLTNWS